MKKAIIFSIIGVLLIISLTFSITYAYISINVSQENPNTIESKCFGITFAPTVEDSKINLGNTYPMSEAKAFTLNPYQFKVSNTCELTNEYKLIISFNITGEGSNLLEYLDYSFDESDDTTKIQGKRLTSLPILNDANAINELSLSGYTYNYVLDSNTFSTQNEQKEYKLRLWIDEAAQNEIMGQNMNGKISVYAEAKSSPTSTEG